MFKKNKNKSSHTFFIHKAKQAVIARTRHFKHVCGALSSRLQRESKVHCITPTPSLRRKKKKKKKGTRKRKKRKKKKKKGEENVELEVPVTSFTPTKLWQIIDQIGMTTAGAA